MGTGLSRAWPGKMGAVPEGPQGQEAQVPGIRIWPEDKKLSSSSEVNGLPWVPGGSEPRPQLGGGDTGWWDRVEQLSRV